MYIFNPVSGFLIEINILMKFYLALQFPKMKLSHKPKIQFGVI